MLTRREFGKFALAGVPAAAVLGTSPLLRALAQTKPNSLIEGVQIGTITYSFRSMPEQTAEATLRYIVESGISAVELMGGPVNDYARKGQLPPSAGAGGRGGGGRAGGGGGGGGARPRRGRSRDADGRMEWREVRARPGRRRAARRRRRCGPSCGSARGRRRGGGGGGRRWTRSGANA